MSNNYISISELNKYIKTIIDEDFNLNNVYIKGEISNFKAHTTGHFYLTLKDEKSRINAVMFASSASKVKFTPKDGMKVLVSGRISVYEANGNYQIYINEMIEDGLGNLYIAFEQLKERLNKAGLFDPSKKKKIPRIPKKIGIVTASTGAAVRDIITTIKRRYPICETILFPSLVQGADAADDIVKNIKLAENYDIDTLIIGRGGGSIEDLWPFNEEKVAIAIYESNIPIISAVGHEIDWTISDFVADLRAPTPTAAAEIAVPDITTIKTYLETAISRGTNSINNIIINKNLKVKKISESYILKHPLSLYEIKEQKLDSIIDKINNIINSKVEKYNIKLFELKNNYILNNPNIIYKFKEQHLIKTIEKLEVLNPLNTLKRGYSITKKDNKIISSVKNIKNEDKITIELKDGSFDGIVVRVGE